MIRSGFYPFSSPQRSPAAPSRSRSRPSSICRRARPRAAQNELLEHWWTAFNDPVLNALVDEAFANNLDLRITLARIQAARSQVLLAQVDLVPASIWSATRTARASRRIRRRRCRRASALTSNDFRLAIQMSYELDVWGKYRAACSLPPTT